MQMQQESRAVRCGNSSPQRGMVCGAGFRLFKLAGLIWPLSMDRLLSPSLSLLQSPFFSFAREDARRDSRPWFMPKSTPFIISLPPSALPRRLPKLFPGLLNVCMREIGNADKRPCKFNPSVCPPFDFLADKEGSPYLPPSPLRSCQPLSYRAAYVSSTGSQGMEERIPCRERPMWNILGNVGYTYLVNENGWYGRCLVCIKICVKYLLK